MSQHKTNKVVRLAASAAVLAVAALSAPVVSAQPAARNTPQECFYPRFIQGFQAPNDHTIYVRVGVNRIFRLDLMSDCPNLSSSYGSGGFGLESVPPGSQICHAIQATVIFRETAIRNQCPVSAMHLLSPAEVAALPRRDLP